MKAIVSLATGFTSFIIITGIQLNLMLQIKANGFGKNIPHIYSIGANVKIIVLILGVIAIVSSIYYSKSDQTKLRLINKLGLILGIIAIVLCFIPFYMAAVG